MDLNYSADYTKSVPKIYWAHYITKSWYMEKLQIKGKYEARRLQIS